MSEFIFTKFAISLLFLAQRKPQRSRDPLTAYIYRFKAADRVGCSSQEWILNRFQTLNSSKLTCENFTKSWKQFQGNISLSHNFNFSTFLSFAGTWIFARLRKCTVFIWSQCKFSQVSPPVHSRWTSRYKFVLFSK